MWNSKCNFVKLNVVKLNVVCYHFPRNMNKYELMVLYKSELSDADVKKKIPLLKKEVEEKNGKVLKEDYWGLKSLAYQMEKQLQAYYLVLEFEIESEQIPKLDTWLKREEDSVLRYLLTKV